MKKYLLTVFCLPVLSLQAQNPEPDIIKADKAFAQMSYDSGARKAFEKYLDDDAVFLSVSPLPIEGKENVLKVIGNTKAKVIWQPTGGAESGDKRSGYTYGISKWVYPIGDSLASSYYLYSTNWKKDSKDEWKVVTDIGTEYFFDKPTPFVSSDSFSVANNSKLLLNKSVKLKNAQQTDFLIVNGNAITRGIVIRPNKQTQGVVFFQHGLGEDGKKEFFLEEAKKLAEQQIASVMIDAPFARRAEEGRIAAGGMRDAALFLANVNDWIAVLNSLGQMKLNNLPVAFTGHSYGARVATFVSVVDKRVENVVLMAGTVNFIEWMQTTMDKDIAGLRKQLPPEAMAAYLQSLKPYDPSMKIALKHSTNYLMQAGSKDETVTVYDFLSSFTIINAPKELKWYDSGHELNEVARIDRLKKFKEWFNLK